MSGFFQKPHHNFLSMNRRQITEPKGYFFPPAPKSKPAVMRNPLFIYFHFRQNFYPGNYSLVNSPGQNQFFMQNPVNPVSDLASVFLGLNMNIRGSGFHGKFQNSGHNFSNRGLSDSHSGSQTGNI